MKHFQIAKTGDRATIEILGPSDLAIVLDLQAATRAALPEAQKMFVLPQSTAYFQSLLLRQNGLMLGVRVNNRLVSQMVVMGQMTLGDAIDRQVITRNDVPFHHALPADRVVIAKSMAVHPDWRGNELSQFMLETMLDLPLTRAADHVFAQISVDNMRSWELFLRHGFGIVAAALDPQDERARFIVQRPAFGFVYGNSPIVDDVDPAADFAAIGRLTQREKLIGRLEGDYAFKLAFHANAEMPSLLHDLPAISG